MSGLGATLKLDIRLQARSRLYIIGIAVAVALGLAGRFAFNAEHAGRVLAAFYLLGVGGTTYIFGPSLVLLEKSQGTLDALRVSPLTSSTYITSRVITLGAFTVLESAVVYVIGFSGTAFDPLTLALGVASLGVLYTLVGIGQVAPHDSVMSFLMPGALIVGGVLQLPVLYVLDIQPVFAWYLVPTQAPLLLMLAAFEPLDPWQWVYAIVVTATAIAMAGWWARIRFARFVGLQNG